MAIESYDKAWNEKKKSEKMEKKNNGTNIK